MSNSRALRRRLVVSLDLRDDAPQRTKEQIARRSLVATTGRCPCGATIPGVTPAPGTVTIVAVEHAPGCPATGTSTT